MKKVTTEFFCNRCGEKLLFSGADTNWRMRIDNARIDDLIDKNKGECFDLCNKCVDDILKTFKTKETK